MIQAGRNWFKRNRTNFAIAAGAIGAGYLATQYALNKLTETRQRMSEERIAKENLRRRFEQNQEDCTFTVLAILPTATENILEALPVEQILAELQKQKAERLARSVGPSEVSTADLPSAPPSVADDESKSLQSSEYIHASQVAENSNGADEPPLKVPASPAKSKRTKAQLWNDMKIQSLARAFTLIYTLSLLTLLTRIQLNLLGRRNYLASVVSLASPPTSSNKISLENRDDDGFESNAYGNDFETNRKYLSFSWWLLHRGCLDITDRVTNAVKEIFGPLNPREDITLEKLSELTVLVRKRIEGFTDSERKAQKWLPYLLPPPSQEDYVLQASGMTSPSAPNTTQSTPFLRRLLDETSDLIDSPAFTHVLTLLLDSAFSLLIDNKLASQSFKIPPISESTARVQEIVGGPESQKCKVANTIAVFTRQAHSIGSGSTNEYLAAMETARDLEAFAAVVYSSNFEFEAPEASATPATSGAQNYSELSLVPSVATTRPGTATDVEMTPASLLPRDQGSEVEDKRLSMMEDELEKAWGKALAREDGQRVSIAKE